MDLVNTIKLPMRRLNRILSMMFEDMKNLSDEGRDLPIRWNIMHMYTSAQVAKILAFKRGINVELAAITAALHDVGVVMTKKKENHALNGVKCVYEILEKYNNLYIDKLPIITKEEMKIIANAIKNHSNKEINSGDPFVELLKDVDSLDRYLHGVNTEGWHCKRCIKVLKELDIER